MTSGRKKTNNPFAAQRKAWSVVFGLLPTPQNHGNKFFTGRRNLTGKRTLLVKGWVFFYVTNEISVGIFVTKAAGRGCKC